MEPAPRVGRVFFPLDEELALLPGSLTPKQQEHVAHLALWMPFERAAHMLQRVLGVQVSEPTVRRLTERAGTLYEARQTAHSQLPPSEYPRKAWGDKQVFSTDGAYISLVGGQWAEVRTLAIGEVNEAVSAHGPTQVKTEQITYFSRMSDADTFGDMAQVEMQRRGVSNAKEVCAVTDGADWIQGFIDLHRPDAMRILDFAHAAEHVTLLIEAMRHAGGALPTQALERCLHILKHRGPGLLLRWCARLPTALSEDEAVQKQLHYLCKRESMMQYPLYQQHGWPIGSGLVESANKLVVQARLKGAGMHWQATHVNPMLALRTAVCNERWEEAWQDTLDEQQTHLKSKRLRQAEARVQAQLTSFVLLLLRFHPPTPKPLPPTPILAHPAATLPGSSRPSAHHPWKRSPACRPKFSAKN